MQEMIALYRLDMVWQQKNYGLLYVISGILDPWFPHSAVLLHSLDGMALCCLCLGVFFCLVSSSDPESHPKVGFESVSGFGFRASGFVD